MLEMTALQLAAAIKDKKLSVIEVTNAYIDKIEKTGNQFNNFISILKERALIHAKEVQSKIDKGETLSPLAGVPIALKDNISVMDTETTCASNMLNGYKPVFNATIVEKLERAGLIIIGKLNMDEFALGDSSQTGAFGSVRNPLDITRVAGGSSGASAAAIAAKEVPLTLGSDMGGSIRQPCSFCGVTGIKPTFGSVSNYGIITPASSLDQTGPLGQNIEDCIALLSIISGPDVRDSTCNIEKPFEFDLTSKDIKNLKIGLPKNYFSNGINEDVKNAVLSFAKEFEKAGAIIEEFEMPLTEYIIPAYCIIGAAEISSNLAKYDGLKYGHRSEKAKTLMEVYRLSRNEGFGIEVKRRIILGSFVLSSGNYETYFKKALLARKLIIKTYKKLFNQFDIILSPVTPTTAFKLGENTVDPMENYMGHIYTASVNLAGIPAVSLPCGFDKQGLSIGCQLIGDVFSETTLVNAAKVVKL